MRVAGGRKARIYGGLGGFCEYLILGVNGLMVC